MSETHFTVDHVHRTTDNPFGNVTTAFERQLGCFEPGVYQALAAGGDAEGARAKIEAMAGPSGRRRAAAPDTSGSRYSSPVMFPFTRLQPSQQTARFAMDQEPSREIGCS
jgi:hypothetical protein